MLLIDGFVMAKDVNENEFADCMTLARQFDVSRDEIKRVVRELKEAGYQIDTLLWGRQNKLKVHAQQFRAAVMHEFRGV